MKKGSALLIVLGLLAFMIVSAVAFSAYMRFARLPSSYLRRNVASRQLVKSAVARAIDDIDKAVCDNPHPGVGNVEMIGTRLRNYWKHRVYIGTNTLCDASETANVLSLEALAYIPPPLVNEARYYARRSPAAKWHTFGFDAGRYAFCALDVSDYLDVNRLRANGPRSSASYGRITLSYLFENDDHTSLGGDYEKWDGDDFMKQFRSPAGSDGVGGFVYDQNNKVPLVSLCDFNLALNDSMPDGFATGGGGKLKSYFCNYIRNNGQNGFYGSEEEFAGRMTFVTDSLFPPEGDELLDLSDPDCQPYTYDQLKDGNGTDMQDIVRAGSGEAFRELMPKLSQLGMITLFDYLDEDSVPATLAAPTVERAPMCVAIQPKFDQVTLSIRQDPENTADAAVFTDADCTTPFTPGPIPAADVATAPKELYARVAYYIDPKGLEGFAGGVDAVFAYPFAHKDGVESERFAVDGKVAVFCCVGGDAVKLRTSSGEDELLHVKEKADFTQSPKLVDGQGVLSFPIEESTAFNKTANDYRRQTEVVQTVRLGTKGIKEKIHGLMTPKRGEIMTVTYKWTVDWTPNGMGQLKPSPATLAAAWPDVEIVKAHCGLPPLSAAGTVKSGYDGDNAFLGKIQGLSGAGGGDEATLNFAVWIRVKSGDDTVDLVPAVFPDDKTLNGRNTTQFGEGWDAICGEKWPVMRFDAGLTFKYNPFWLAEQAASPAPTSIEISPKAVMVEDPRYNAAPESWFAYNGGDVSEIAWLAEGNNSFRDRDGDIFLATSDQGYLQSIYELAFLPRLGDLRANASPRQTGDYENPQDKNYEAFPERGKAANRHLMWRTYRPYETDDGAADGFGALGFTSAGTGFKINPYTDSTNVMMAAFANTPVDWAVASTNKQMNAAAQPGVTAQDYFSDYAWNEQGDNKLDYDTLVAIAGKFMAQMRGTRPGDSRDTVNAPGTGEAVWTNAWDSLDWYGNDENSFCLYGYWKDCFAVKQQLYLVFVRAEPMMMGGGSLSKVPPQLGGRAVALVWRDPAPNGSTVSVKNPETGELENGTGYPHRTRILFYKQLE